MKRILIVFMACLSLSACVKPDDVRTLDNRVYEQQLRLDALEAKVDQQSEVDPQKADTWAQVQSMRQELAEAKNELAALNRQIQVMKSESEAAEAVAEDVKDLKIGWQRLNSQLGADVDLAAIRAERIPDPGPATPDILEPVDAASAAAPDAETPASDEAAASADNVATTPAQTTAPAPQGTQPEIAINADAASTLYKSARAAFEARDYRQGIALWDEFASSFPNHQLVPNALFWQGECYFQIKEYARAVLKYQVVIDKHQKSPKYPTSLLKQGISFMRLGRVKAGKLLLSDVAKKFPTTAEGKRAESILKQTD
ncbi:MAG: tol-pal system protein YbgF [Proteobacteria bacterium]|nr:tol-pal system protein YbgF [Pseudomonadota bacterium]